jgi:hypothetical protein
MYEDRTPLTDTRDLNQGDLLRGILRPLYATAKNFAILKDGNKFKHPAPTEAVFRVDKELRVVLTPQREDLSIVASNSCDNALGNLPILIVPALPYKFLDDTSAEERWLEISQAATGSGNSKRFYLPGSDKCGFGRSTALLNLIFPISHDYIERCVKDAQATRLCGLTPEAQRHFQWALSLFFGRNPREDLDWPSREDLELKRQWLDSMIIKGGRNQQKYKEDLAVTEAALAKFAQTSAERDET